MEIKHFDLVVDGSRGIYIPQFFAEHYPEWCTGEEEILLAGPDHPDYWEAWEDVRYSKHDGSYLYDNEHMGGSDLFIISDCAMGDLIVAWESSEELDDCPNELRGIVQKLAYEFLTDGEGFISEDEALCHFAPFIYNDALVNRALEWMRKELKEVKNG